MKKWKLIVITAILCMTVGMQALAAEVPTEVTEPVENEPTENTDQSETPAGNGETKIVTNLPSYDGDFTTTGTININGTAVCDDGNVEISGSGNWGGVQNYYTKSPNSISQEEAQKILGSRKLYETLTIEFKPALMGEHPELNNKTVKEIIIKTVRLEFDTNVLPKSLYPYYRDFNGTEAAEKANESSKILYFPSGETSYKECKFSLLDTDGIIFITGLEGAVLPLEGARLVFIWGDPEGATVEPESTPSSDSVSSGEPEIYSHGATVGEIGVKKSGAGVQAHVRKANGEETEVIVHPYLNPGTKTLTQAQARQMLGTSFACSIYSFDLSIVNAQEDYGTVTLIDGTVPVTFFVPGVTPESKVALRHWINGSSTYEDLPVEVGNGTVKAEFTSFSPVVIVVEQPGVAATVENGPVSPKTGESSVIYVVEAVALLSLLGLFTCRRKRQA